MGWLSVGGLPRPSPDGKWKESRRGSRFETSSLLGSGGSPTPATKPNAIAGPTDGQSRVRAKKLEQNESFHFRPGPHANGVWCFEGDGQDRFGPEHPGAKITI